MAVQAMAKFATSTGGASSAGLLLSLQLACNVLVVACPCALGLAAPTAVLVGTSAAARRCRLPFSQAHSSYAVQNHLNGAVGTSLPALCACNAHAILHWGHRCLVPEEWICATSIALQWSWGTGMRACAKLLMPGVFRSSHEAGMHLHMAQWCMLKCQARYMCSDMCRGLLIRGGDILEAASHIDTVIFDKTGTLTLGKPSLVDIKTAEGFSRADVLAYAAAIERHSSHPLARAIASTADSEGAAASYGIPTTSQAFELPLALLRGLIGPNRHLPASC